MNLNFIPTKRTGFSLNPDIYEVSDKNRTLEHLLPVNVKISGTVDDIRIKSNFKINQALFFTEKSFFYTTLTFAQSHSYPLDDIEGFY